MTCSLLLLRFLASDAQAEQTHNQTIQSVTFLFPLFIGRRNFRHHVELTPGGIKYINYRNDGKDGYLEEDDRSWMYKTHYLCGKYCGYRETYCESVLECKEYYVSDLKHGLQIYYRNGVEEHKYYFNDILCTIEMLRTYFTLLPEILQMVLMRSPHIKMPKVLLLIIENYLLLPTEMMQIILKK